MTVMHPVMIGLRRRTPPHLPLPLLAARLPETLKIMITIMISTLGAIPQPAPTHRPPASSLTLALLALVVRPGTLGPQNMIPFMVLVLPRLRMDRPIQHPHNLQLQTFVPSHSLRPCRLTITLRNPPSPMVYENKRDRRIKRCRRPASTPRERAG